MQRKTMIRRMLIIITAVLIALFLVVNFLGRTETAKVVVLAKDGIDTTKFLDDQMDYFVEKTILASELKLFDGTVAISKAQLQKKKLVQKVKPGSPILLSNLTEKGGGGTLASTIPQFRTLFMLGRDAVGLPPGVAAGDKVDVGVIADAGQGKTISSIMLRGVTIHSIDGGSIYLNVSQQEYLKLMIGNKVGQYFLVLPGRAESHECSPEETEKRKQFINVDCYTKDDAPITVSRDQVLQMLTTSPLDYTTPLPPIGSDTEKKTGADNAPAAK